MIQIEYDEKQNWFRWGISMAEIEMVMTVFAANKITDFESSIILLSSLGPFGQKPQSTCCEFCVAPT